MVLLYSVSEERSFVVVKDLYKKIQSIREDDYESLPIAVCGNKCDLDLAHHVVSAEEVKEWCASKGYDFSEASAKTGKNVNEPFHYLARKLIAQHNVPSVVVEESSSSCC